MKPGQWRELREENERLREKIGRLEAVATRAAVIRGEPDFTRLELDAVFQAYPHLLFLIGADDRFLDYRTGRDAGLYVTPAQFLGRRISEVLPAAAGESLLAGLARTREADAQVVVEYEMPTPAGPGYYEARLVPVGEGRVAALVLDITQRKRQEQDLRASEVAWRSLFDSNPHPLWVYDVETLRFLAVNEATVVTYGYGRDEFLGMTILDLHGPEEAARIRADLPRLPAGYFAAGLCRHRCKDGRVLDVEVSSHGLTFAGRKARLVLDYDVTAGLAAQRALRESEARLRAIIDTEPECVKIVSLDGAVQEMNPAGIAMLEADSLAQVQSLPLTDFLDPPERAPFLDLFRRVLSGESGTLRFWVTGFRGTRRRLESSATPLRDPRGQITAMLAITRDITDRWRAEEALRHSEERFRALIERSTDILFIVDSHGDITFGSPSVEESLGYRPDGLIGQSVFDLVHSEDLPRARELFDELRQDPDATTRVVMRFRHRDGRWRLLESVSRSFYHLPSIGGLVVNARDITEQRGLEDQLRQAQKLESIGRLAGGLAHDFNNLLTAILGYSELLAENLDPQSTAASFVGEIHKAGERARDLTHQMLAFARRQVIAPRRIDLNAVIRDSERLLHRLLGEDIDIETGLADGLWPVKADPTQVQQVIVNLAVNARDAMPDGGRITIRTANARLDPASAQADTDVAPGPFVRLAVSDTGYGMGPEVMGHLFEPFFTTKPIGQGTGLGLATVYGIVKQSGGHIEVRSEVGQGTTFDVYFPRSEESTAAREARVPRSARRGTGTILVVEDEAVVRELITRSLRDGGYRVLAAAGGREALDLAAATEGTIDLLVADLVMSGMNGRQVAAELEKERPALRVLFVSGYPQSKAHGEETLDGGPTFLAKPFTPSVLLARVREILSEGSRAAGEA